MSVNSANIGSLANDNNQRRRLLWLAVRRGILTIISGLDEYFGVARKQQTN